MYFLQKVFQLLLVGSVFLASVFGSVFLAFADEEDFFDVDSLMPSDVLSPNSDFQNDSHALFEAFSVENTSSSSPVFYLVGQRILSSADSDKEYRLSSDLSVAKTLLFSEEKPGVADVTVSVTNNGPAVATSVVVKDYYQGGIIKASGDIPKSCLFARQKITCSSLFLPAGKTLSFSYSVFLFPMSEAKDGGYKMFSQVGVSSMQEDRNEQNNFWEQEIVFPHSIVFSQKIPVEILPSSQMKGKVGFIHLMIRNDDFFSSRDFIAFFPIPSEKISLLSSSANGHFLPIGNAVLFYELDVAPGEEVFFSLYYDSLVSKPDALSAEVFLLASPSETEMTESLAF